MLRAVIFDFDGVIADSFPDQFDWFKYICNLLEKPFKYNSHEEFKQDYKVPIYPNMYEFLGFDWDREKDIIWPEYNKHKANAKIPIFEGIDEVIKELDKKGLDLAIASINTHKAIEKPLEEYDLKKYFKTIIGREDLPTHNCERLLKPDPACLLLALGELEYSPQETISIGDHPTDIMAARNIANYLNGIIPTIAVTYGFGLKDKLLEQKPEFIVDKPIEILEKINQYNPFP